MINEYWIWLAENKKLHLVIWALPFVGMPQFFILGYLRYLKTNQEIYEHN